MYCTNCGAKNDNDAKFCYNCGQQIKNEENDYIIEKTNAKFFEQGSSLKRKSLFIMIGTSTLLFLVMLVIFIIYFTASFYEFEIAAIITSGIAFLVAFVLLVFLVLSLKIKTINFSLIILVLSVFLFAISFFPIIMIFCSYFLHGIFTSYTNLLLVASQCLILPCNIINLTLCKKYLIINN